MSISQTIIYRNDEGTVIEHDLPYPVDLLAPGTYHATVPIPVNTPRGEVGLPVRVPLIGAQSLDDAFARFQELIHLNHREPTMREIQRQQRMAQEAIQSRGQIIKPGGGIG